MRSGRDSTSGGVFTLLAEYILESGGVVFGAAFDGTSICGTPPASARRSCGACGRQSTSRAIWRASFGRCGAGWTSDQCCFPAHLPGGRAVPLSGRTAGESDHLRPGATACPLPACGRTWPGAWRRRQRAAAGGPFPQQGRRMEGQPFYRGLRRRHRGYRAAVPHGIRPGLRRALFLRPSCYRCPYASMTRVGDLTLGDFWGLRPDELPDQQEKGISLLLVNTPTAATFLTSSRWPSSPSAGTGHCRKSPAGISHSPAAGADGILCRLRPGALRPGAPGVLPPAAAASTGRRPAAVAGGQGGHPEEAEVSTVSTGIQACIARL